MKLLIIRHGDPNYAIDSLTPTGWEEAALVAERIAKLDVKAFYVSPMGRAQATASETLKKMNRSAQTLPWLREFSAGVRRADIPGISGAWDWLPQDWTAEPRFFDREQWLETEPFRLGGADKEARWVTQGLDDLLKNHGYRRDGEIYRAENPNEDTVVLFCHFGVECVILGHLLHLSPMVLWHSTCAAPASVTTVTTEERRKGIASFRMNAFGDTSHLYAAGREPSFSARFCETFDNLQQRHD